jgi:hypothetical protein
MTRISNVGAKFDFAMRQGADLLLSLTFTNADGSPYDLTYSALSAQMRKLPGDISPAGVFSFASSVPTSGVTAMSMAASLTALVTCGPTLLDPLSQYIWDMEDKNTQTGIIWSPLQGVISVFREVTKP